VTKALCIVGKRRIYYLIAEKTEILNLATEIKDMRFPSLFHWLVGEDLKKNANRMKDSR
jgi:hypothetical protein